jgi:hypothetical protein
LDLGIIIMLLMAFAGCGQHDSQSGDSLKRDHAAISKMLDSALLSEAPIDSFRVVLETVKSFPSVDSAWIDGVTFYVKYKQGGILAWTAPPQPTTNGEERK